MERSELESTVNRVVSRWAPVLLPGWDVSVQLAKQAVLAERMGNEGGTYGAMTDTFRGEMKQIILVNEELDWSDNRWSVEQTVIHELMHAVTSAADAAAKATHEYFKSRYPADGGEIVLSNTWDSVHEELCDRLSVLFLRVERSL